jgi:flavin reductase (DIM6/NTAB) family NADH-FMN oxidoreductase RutF
MTKSNDRSIIVGVTGHRDLRPEDRAVLTEAVKGELERLRALFPHSELQLLCSLAEGADLLCAGAAEELGIPLIAVLPLPLAVYTEDFTPEGRRELDRQLDRAEQVFQAPDAEAVPEAGKDRDHGYRQAGLYVAVRSHILLALWDGLPGPAAPCGTAAAVSFALEGDRDPGTVVAHIFTPRNGQTGRPGVLRRLGDWGAMESWLKQRDIRFAQEEEKMEFQTDVFAQFQQRWALLTAGTPADFNTMTISWGGMGTLWSKPVVTVYVKPIRHTYGYMERNGFFTVSFYPESYRRDLLTLGTKSGRDGDKVALTGLTPKALERGVTFAQAEATLVCRKLYAQDLDRAAMPREVAESVYATEAPHRMYIGEVVEILR